MSIDCSKYTLFDFSQKREKYNGKKQYKVLFKMLKNFEIYEPEDLKILEYLEEKELVKNKKLTEKGKCYIIFMEWMNFDMKSYLLYMFIIFWLPIILIYFWKYIPIDWKYWTYFYFFMLTFWILFIMRYKSNKREEYIKEFKNKYFS